MATSNPVKASSSGSLIKSKARVRDLAEVYTAEREVKAMLDLIPDFTVEQTYLEPACGNGNFLVEILRRKLQASPVTKPYFERNKDGHLAPFPKGGKAEPVFLEAIKAVSTSYGFDICPLNVAEAKVRLYAYVVYGEDLFLPAFLTGKDPHTLNYIEAVTPDHGLPLAPDYEANLYNFADKTAKLQKTSERAKTVSADMLAALRIVLSKNIQQGDFLAQTDSDGKPLVVGKWQFFGDKVRREDYLLSDVGTSEPVPVGVMALRSLSDFVAHLTRAL